MKRSPIKRRRKSQPKVLAMARNQPCMVRLPCCNGDDSTTVAAHYRLAGTCGTGMKPDEQQVAWCCCKCHDVVDGRAELPGWTREQIRLAHCEGVLRTQATIRRLAA